MTINLNIERDLFQRAINETDGVYKPHPAVVLGLLNDRDFPNLLKGFATYLKEGPRWSNDAIVAKLKILSELESSINARITEITGERVKREDWTAAINFYTTIKKG